MFSGFSKIQHISLESNYLTGTLPPSMAKLSTLDWFDISYNSLTGSLPLVTANTQLSNMYMNYNLLSGKIPPSWANLTNVQNLRFDNNQARSSPCIPPPS